MPTNSTGSSAVSKSSRHPTTSEVTRSYDFEALRDLTSANHFSKRADPVIDATLMDIYTSTKLPMNVTEEIFSKSISLYSKFSRTSFDNDILSPEDPYNLSFLKYGLLMLWNELTLAVQIRKSQSDVRSTVNVLMRRAFDSRYRLYGDRMTTKVTIYETDQELVLPHLNPGKVEASGVVWSPIPNSVSSLLEFLNNRHVFSCTESTDWDVSMPTFVFEANLQDEKAAVLQICLDLCSAQHQRRALGFKDHHIYGAVLVRNEFTLYSSEWDGEIVNVTPTLLTFQLESIQNFLLLYVFLCRLAEFIVQQLKTMDEESNRDKDRYRKLLEEAAKKQWRPLKHSSRRKSGGKLQPGSIAGAGIDEAMVEAISEAGTKDVDIQDDNPDTSPTILNNFEVDDHQAASKCLHDWLTQQSSILEEKKDGAMKEVMSEGLRIRDGNIHNGDQKISQHSLNKFDIDDHKAPGKCLSDGI